MGDELVQDVHNGSQVGQALDGTGQHVEDGPVERAEDSLQGEEGGAAAPLGLKDELEDELEYLVGLLPEDGLPELVHEAGGQVEHVGSDVIG